MEAERLIELWRRAKMQGDAVYLATVVHVQGSSYRKPGARMLVTSGGERAGTISGGCLEAEVSRKIAWLTQQGSSLQSYQSSFDDDNEGVPYGLGCGGTIWVLMESGEVVDAIMEALRLAFEARVASVVVSSLGQNLPHRSLVIREGKTYGPDSVPSTTFSMPLVMQALLERRVVVSPGTETSLLPEFICMPILPSPRLHVFGAGDDAQPIVRFASELGWEVTVADGRSHLLRVDRFPKARQLELLPFDAAGSFQTLELSCDPTLNNGDSAVILTHSYGQDRAILKTLLLKPLHYLGILGPLNRTRRLLDDICCDFDLSVEECLARLHAPVGLSIGSGDPAVIALSIVAEIQATLTGVPRQG
jgi:xanthine/CO dehydrogenase XdhC/CoxF family maturation factor